jgi:NAD/NADP transhydrogenase alpha subunit
MPKTFKADGEKHTVKKNSKGDVIVDHAVNKGKYDNINLTKKAGAKTVKEGVKATKDWHKKNPHKKGK